MKCFIHVNDEAIAVCKRCGKAMCGNCSAYTNHSGICPECRRDEFIQERNILEGKVRANKSSVTVSIVLIVVFAVLAVLAAVFIHVAMLCVLIGSLIFGIRIPILLNRRKPLLNRINYLTGEINKLNVALQRSAAII